MSKGNKKVQVEVKETPNNREGLTELELYVNGKKNWSIATKRRPDSYYNN